MLLVSDACKRSFVINYFVDPGLAPASKHEIVIFIFF